MVYPCPCCGYLQFDALPGSYEICEICYWEDDGVQLRWPDRGGGANDPSLIEAQQNFVQYGAMEERFSDNVRSPNDNDIRDTGWRPIQATDSFGEPGQKQDWPDDVTTLYWWRDTFWRLKNSG